MAHGGLGHIILGMHISFNVCVPHGLKAAFISFGCSHKKQKSCYTALARIGFVSVWLKRS